ncbi:MAG: hypothetical protein JRI23_35200, partial [Deltaproteobacteria bacterium]|nr:hypothetical protein [Deltaproteobacteria bacterium]MBW2537561.1 hypothetical protein [Deltaproteobacteria bacterium]
GAGGGGQLQFRSGFEPDTAWQPHRIHGIDQSAPSGVGDWDALPTYLGWMWNQMAFFEPQGGANSISIVPDPLDGTNSVLHLHNVEKMTSGSSERSRSQLSLWQAESWSDVGGTNLFDQQFYRFKMLLPVELESSYAFAERAQWYMIWESHAWDDDPGRHGIYVCKRADSSQWYFHVVQQNPEGVTTTWENTTSQWYDPVLPDSDFGVPFGQWMTVEIFFKYHPTDGAFFVAVTPSGGSRRVMADFHGQTQFGNKVFNQTMFKMYHHGAFIDRMGATHQYYDDFEVWTDFPPGY